MRIGNWEIVNLIGKGRWSNAALAKPHGCQSNNADYVIKYIDPSAEGFEYARTMLIREMACSELVSHASIISFLDCDLDHETPFLVSARHPGESILELNQRLGLLMELREKLTSFRQICEGLRELHRVGIRHGDLSPSNILVDLENSQALVVDLGLSEKVNPFHRETDCVAGTWGYVAPECINGRTPINLSSDIFSLGKTMREFFTGIQQQNLRNSFAGVRNVLEVLLDTMCAANPLKRPTILEVIEQVSLLEISCLERDYPTAA